MEALFSTSANIEDPANSTQQKADYRQDTSLEPITTDIADKIALGLAQCTLEPSQLP
jgi:hypothetical protein